MFPANSTLDPEEEEEEKEVVEGGAGLSLLDAATTASAAALGVAALAVGGMEMASARCSHSESSYPTSHLGGTVQYNEPCTLSAARVA